ncbi:MAG: GNAT family N-acetyltransferase [Cyclobacteriaceae bacterium]
MNSSIEISKIKGDAIKNHLQALAELRIQVFKDFPYLYKGSTEYEIEYLKPYLKSPDAAFFIVKDKNRTVGASTCVPLLQEDKVFQKPFKDNNFEINAIMYFGESVLLPAYRGLGIGKEFFRLRESYANQFKHIRYCTFCAVERPSDHPLKPENYRMLNAFWLSMGYHQHPELFTYLSWQDIDQTNTSDKKMIFWLKQIR